MKIIDQLLKRLERTKDRCPKCDAFGEWIGSGFDADHDYRYCRNCHEWIIDDREEGQCQTTQPTN